MIIYVCMYIVYTVYACGVCMIISVWVRESVCGRICTTRFFAAHRIGSNQQDGVAA